MLKTILPTKTEPANVTKNPLLLTIFVIILTVLWLFSLIISLHLHTNITHFVKAKKKYNNQWSLSQKPIAYTSAIRNFEKNITLELSRRKYDSTYSLEYESVDLADYVTNRLTATSTPNEYLLFNVPITQINISYNLKENLTSGTYRLTFKIYDETEFIGEVYKYIVIK